MMTTQPRKFPVKTFKTILQLKRALDRGDFKAKDLIAFNDCGELFIRSPKAPNPEMNIFTAYYGRNGCEDICLLLGIQQEIV